MNYWVVIDRRKFGPLTLEEARNMPLKEDTYVWRSGLPAWVRARELAELADLFVTAAPAPAEDAETTVTLSETASVSEPDVVVTETVTDTEEPDGRKESESEVTVTVAGPEKPVKPMPVPPPPPPAPPVMSPYMRPQSAIPPKPPTYLGWSIASILLCCVVTGVISVIYASKVTGYYESGRYEDAVKASEKAEMWLIIGITVGIVLIPFEMLLL